MQRIDSERSAAVNPSGLASAPVLRLSSSTRVAELDGFRAIAVSMVFILHICFASKLPADALSWMPGLLFQFISHGWLGVDLFFVLSGLLITGILLDSKESPGFFQSFYARRALRILPLYFACIAVMALCYRGAGDYFSLASLFLANFSSAFGVRQPHGPGVFWSLAVEEHFYLLWPILVFVCGRRMLLAISIAVIIASPVLRGMGAVLGMEPETQIYQYSFFRCDGLALGAVIAIAFRARGFSKTAAWKLAASMLAVDILITALGWRYGVMGRQTTAALALRYSQAQLLFGALIVLALTYRGARATWPLRCRAAGFIAELSFCIYLVHLALIDLYVAVLPRLGMSDLQALGPVGCIVLRACVVGMATLAVAMLSRRYLELPMLSLKTRFAYRSARPAPLGETIPAVR